MTQALLFLLLGLTAGVAFVWSRRRRLDNELTATALPPVELPAPVEARSVELPKEVDVPSTQAEVRPQTDRAFVPEVANDSASPASSGQQTNPSKSGDTTSGHASEITAATLPPNTLQTTEAANGEAEQPISPPLAGVPPTLQVRDETSSRSRLAKVLKPEGTNRAAPERRGGGQMETGESGKPAEQRKRTRSEMDPKIRTSG